MRLKIIFAILFLIGPIGFIGFIIDIMRPISYDQILHSDGIVVLTGGKERIPTALHLLEKNPNLNLLISGVAPTTTLKQITSQITHPLKPEIIDRISLGYYARSTSENGQEIAQWCHDKNLSSLVVVTANYHILRALIEIHAAAPNLKLTAWRVAPPLTKETWHKPTFIIVLHEYGKLLATMLLNINTLLSLPSHIDYQ